MVQRLLTTALLLPLVACTVLPSGDGEASVSSSVRRSNAGARSAAASPPRASAATSKATQSKATASKPAASKPSASKPAVSQTRVITVTTRNWAFSPATIRAKKGEKVQVKLTGVEGVHGFFAAGLGINASVAAGQTTTVSLPTATAGTFSFRCSIPCGAGHQDMTGMIIIEE